MTVRCKKGDWIEIHQVILKGGERAKDVPPDTAELPLEAWIKGWAQGDAAVGEQVVLETLSGRKVEGTLTQVDPGYSHTYGPAVPELAPVSKELRAMLKGGGSRG